MTSLNSLIKNGTIVMAIPLGVDTAKAGVITNNNFASKTNQIKNERILVTWDIEIAEKTSQSTNLKIIKYDQVDEIFKITNSLIIFDSIQHFISSVEISPTDSNISLVGPALIPQFTKNGNTLIFLITLGVDEFFIKSISSVEPNSLLVQSKFLDINHMLIKFYWYKSIMTSRQQSIYQSRRIIEASESEQIKKGNVISQEVCNIAYPDDIETKLSAHTIPSFKEIIGDKKLNLDVLLTDAPKLRELCSFITLLRYKRHVVYTRYAHHYGGELIAYLLRHFTGISVYECYSLEDQDIAMSKFNTDLNSPGIIVTTLSLDMATRPLGVDHLHLVDGSLGKVESLISNIYKYDNYSQSGKIPQLEVHSYICALPRDSKEMSIDEIVYIEFSKRLAQKMIYWNKIIAEATPVYVSNGDLIV
jgi:hypothetical protein